MRGSAFEVISEAPAETASENERWINLDSIVGVETRRRQHCRTCTRHFCEETQLVRGCGDNHFCTLQVNKDPSHTEKQCVTTADTILAYLVGSQAAAAQLVAG